MIIQNSNIAMSSNRLYHRRDEESYSGAYLDASQVKGDASSKPFTNLLNNISSTQETKPVDTSLSQKDSNKIRLQTINWLLKVLFYHGKAGKIEEGQELAEDYANTQNTGQSYVKYVNMTHSSYTYEHEECEFSTMGSVTTADGRSIDFGISFSMSRTFESYTETSITQALNMVDPLVINLEGNPISIADQKFHFDLDCDGGEEELSNLAARSGFLALDLNGDGIINDGSELFGTKSGDGFYDLSQYDLDGNGWIDEADEIFSALRILTFNPDGSQSLYSLKESDVGAICLKHLSTNFALTDENNSTNAMLRSSGAYLHEDGRAGIISHLDLAVG